MKKDKKLTLNKQTVSKLTENGKVKGGVTPAVTIIITSIFSCLSECLCTGRQTEYQSCQCTQWASCRSNCPACPE